MILIDIIPCHAVMYTSLYNRELNRNSAIPDPLKMCGPTNGTEGMTQLQVECINWHLITHRQDSHSGEVAGGVGDIGTGCHTG